MAQETSASNSGTDTDDARRAVVGRGSLYTLATAAPILVAAVVTPLVTRSLGPEEYGVIALCLVIIQVGAMAGGLGMAAAITRDGIIEKSGVSGARGLAIVGTGASTLLLGIFAIASPLWSDLLLGSPWRLAILLACVAAVGFCALLNSQAVLRVLDRPVAFVSTSAIATLGGALLGLLLLRLGRRPSPELYIAGLLGGQIVAGLIGHLLVHVNHRSIFSIRNFRRALATGLPTVPHQVSLYLLNGSVVLLASHLFGQAGSARMALVLVLGTAPGTIIASLNNSWAPVIYRATPHRRGAVLENTSRDVMEISAVLVGGVAIVSPWALSLMAPSSYSPQELAPGVAIVAVGGLISVAYLANVHLVFAVGRSTPLAILTPSCLAIGLLSAIGLAELTGSLLAVSSSFPVAYLSLAIGASLLRRRASDISWHENKMILPLLVGVLLATAGAFLPIDDVSTWVRLALLILICGYGITKIAKIVRGARTDNLPDRK